MSIEQKLRLLIAAVVGLTVISAGCVFVPWALNRFAVEQESELRAMAGSVGFSASFSMDGIAVNANRLAEAREELAGILERVERHPFITAAAIYHEGPEGAIVKLSEYSRDGMSRPPGEAPLPGFDPDRLELTVEALDLQENHAGWVYMRGDLSRKRDFGRRLWTAVAVALACAWGVTFLAGFPLQRALIGPLRGLLNTTQRVRDDRDYTVRANVVGGDELGQLGAGFNRMLEQIERQDETLRRHQQDLEVQVAERTRELREANLRLIDAKEAAEAANRAKSTFLANVSHELRTPLTAIIGYSEMVMEELAESDSSGLKPDVSRIQRSGKILLTLINEVLDLSKIEAGRLTLALEKFDMVALLDEVRDDMKHMADTGGNRIMLELECGRMDVQADRTKVRQIVCNLVGNACKFTVAGTIKIRLATSGTGRDERVILTVLDDGRGMSGEELGRVFEPFVQANASTHREFGGTGLGLPISRRLCLAMGGELTAESEPGRGSAFTATFLRLVERRHDRPVGVQESDPADPAEAAADDVAPAMEEL